jgi:OOP family OmpA-OmpF porin
MQLQFGREMSTRFSLEGLLGYHDIDGYPDQQHLELGVNAVGNLLPHSVVSPYFIGGLGYLRADVGEPDFGGLPTAGSTSSAATATAGLGLRVDLGDSPWSLRAEWRLRRTFDSDDSLTDQIGSIGVQYSFGSGAQRAAPIAIARAEPVEEAEPVQEVASDTDSDGVIDDRDLCPGTARGADVDANGCEKIRLKNVYFDTESAQLSEAEKRKLDEAAESLARRPDLKLEIAGHADSRGPEDYNLTLSERRAAAVVDYLEQKGIERTRLTARGYGESRPSASNDTVLGRADNRRVELLPMGG